jgi:hypothetical protein
MILPQAFWEVSESGWPDDFVKKISQKVAQIFFCQNYSTNITVETSSPKMWATCVNIN